MNKREFVCAVGGALLGTGGAAQATSSTSSTSSTGGQAHGATAASQAGAPDWQARVGERFELVGRHGPGWLQLQRVDLRLGHPGTEQFSLLFSASGAVPGGTHVLRHAQQGLLALMLCEAGNGAPGQALMRADCCRLV